MVEKRLYQQREEEKSIRPFQTGTGIEYLTDEERYGFDITGYLILEDFLSAGQVHEASRQLQESQVSPLEHVTLRRNGPETELLNVVECGGMLEQAFVHGRLVQDMQQLIWEIRFAWSRPGPSLANPESRGISLRAASPTPAATPVTAVSSTESSAACWSRVSLPSTTP